MSVSYWGPSTWVFMHTLAAKVKESDFSVIDENGTSYVDKEYTKAYLRHLLVCNEYLAAQIASIHNLAFYLWLVTEARNQILNGTFYNWKKNIVHDVERRL